MAEKNKGGRGNRSPNSRRNSPRIAISIDHVNRVDVIKAITGGSRADVVEQAIDSYLAHTLASTTEERLEELGLIE